MHFRARIPTTADTAEFYDRYGAWAIVTPDDVRAILDGFDAPWWIAGGWAIDAFTGSSRGHDDIDVCIFRDNTDDFRRALDDRYHLWSVGPLGLRPLTDETPLHPDADQIWIRENARSPWLLDILVTRERDGRGTRWTAADGLRYLAPEYVLSFKAKYLRDKDIDDFDRAWPLLAPDARRVLHDYLSANHPGHDWLSRQMTDGS
ncbi:nucleotidyltransferase domain-containing protein [Gordonia sp. CPCC 205333]|uniref:nucleotidyltransferase domain-containing protein n=1 Tax=Gordonia sp. CPCC 205333 TaxID=3140790 RepID=UPI003AF3C7CF